MPHRFRYGLDGKWDSAPELCQNRFADAFEMGSPELRILIPIIPSFSSLTRVVKLNLSRLPDLPVTVESWMSSANPVRTSGWGARKPTPMCGKQQRLEIPSPVVRVQPHAILQSMYKLLASFTWDVERIERIDHHR